MSKFVHMELNTSDVEAAQKFYKAIFGWKYQKMKMEDGSVYIGFTGDGDGIGGGMQNNPNPGAPSSWTGYVGVASVKKTIAKVEKNGGKVILPEMPIPNMGSLAIFTDPQGAVFAVWQPAMKAPEPAPAAAAPAEAAPAKAKKAAKKAGGKKAAKKDAVAAEPAPAPAKKTAKKAAKKDAAAAEPAPAKKTAKKAAKKG
jgi:predicted enzyme related to lactoylglutathione lyase